MAGTGDFENLPPGRDTPLRSERRRLNADLELVRRALQGAPRDLDELVERLRCIPRVLAARNRRMGNRLSPEDVADLAQDTFGTVWKKLDTFRGEAPLEAWIHPFCVLTLMNFVRRQAYRDTDELFDVHAARAERGVERLDDELVHDALDRVPADEARILRLKHFEDLSFPQIGERLGISPNTAKTRHYRGLDRLRRLLEPAFAPPELHHG